MTPEARLHPQDPLQKTRIENVRVNGVKRLVTPAQVKDEIPASPQTLERILNARETSRRILRGEDPRLMVVVGPCSIHDPVSAMDYARRLCALARELEDRIFVVMRVYFEKPRTTVGWKGLINDPHLDDSADVEYGIKLARRLLLDISELGLPAGTEFLDPIIPQYIADLISWRRSVRAPLNHKPTAKWQVAFPCRSDSKTVRMVVFRRLSMRCARPAHSTVFSELIRRE
jgi:3-deoxy-D-arabino-heptulosonate 7-phosphate (DAHP) synthase